MYVCVHNIILFKKRNWTKNFNRFTLILFRYIFYKWRVSNSKCPLNNS